MSMFFHISEAVKGLTKARLASLLSITSIMLTIILLALFIIFSLNLNTWIGSFREKIELEIFMKSGVSANQINNISAGLKKIPGIQSIQFVSKKDAAIRFEKEFGQNIYDVLDFNPLPPSFIIILADSSRNYKSIQKIANKIEQLPFIDEVVYQKLLLESVDKYITLIYLSAVFVGLIITLIAVALIYNTIRLTIYARRDTIYIMRLVGATQSFIRKPFIIEGMVQGFIASALASIIIFYFVKFIRHFVYPFLVFNNQVFLYLIGFGLIIGLMSAGMSVAKFLKSI